MRLEKPLSLELRCREEKFLESPYCVVVGEELLDGLMGVICWYFTGVWVRLTAAA